jgi:hypothetical protein
MGYFFAGLKIGERTQVCSLQFVVIDAKFIIMVEGFRYCALLKKISVIIRLNN